MVSSRSRRSREVGSRAIPGQAPASAALVGSILLIAVVLVVFWPLTDAGFTTWDDLATVGQNPRLEHVSWASVADYWRHPAMDLYIPVTYSVWALLAWLSSGAAAGGVSSLNAVWFHSANLVIHALSTLVVFALLRQLVRQAWAAVIGALIFAVHPVQVEAVAWVSGSKDVLSGLLALVALWCWVRMTRAKDESASRRWWRCATVALVLGLLAKPGVMMTPLLASIISYVALDRPLSVDARRLAVWFGVAAAFAALAVVTQPAPHLQPTPLWTRPFIAADALWFYARQVVLPLQLAVDYGRTPQIVLSHWSGYAAIIVPIAIAGLLWAFRTRMPLIQAGVVLCGAALLPMLGIVPFDFQRYSTVADHYMYVAMFGVTLVAAAVLMRAPRWAVAVACGAVVMLGVKSHAQAETWQNSRTLYMHMLEVNPRSFLAHNNLGYEMVEAGALRDAVPHYEEAIRLFPGYRDAHFNLAWVREHLGDRTGAIAEYRETLRIDPAYLAARQNVAAVLAADNQLTASLEDMRLVLQAAPESALWHANTGAVLARLGRLDEAVREYEEALRLQPGFPRAVEALRVIRQGRD